MATISARLHLVRQSARTIRRLTCVAAQLTTELIDTDDSFCAQRPDITRTCHWVFLGAPGVGKGTYCDKLSKLLRIPHISMGDLLRGELKNPSIISQQKFAVVMRQGRLLPDEMIFDVLSKRLEKGAESAERGFILDGFPRTINQAVALENIAKIDLAVNLQLREDILIAKCLGRRICSECGGNFNLAEIDVDGIHMPKLLPPPACACKMTIRADDRIEAIKERLRIYHQESAPVEEFYQMRGKLVNLSVAGGIPETWPKLIAALNIEANETGERWAEKLAV